MPGSVVLVVLKPALLPKNSVSTSAAAALVMQWPERYSGCGGVGTSGVQVGSGTVSGLPSSYWVVPSFSRIAWTGRQKLKRYLVSKTTTTASERAMLSRAKMRAFSATLVCRSAAIARAIRFQESVVLSNQKRAPSVCSGVRRALVVPPYSLTSLTSAAYSALVRAGGPGTWNCVALSRTKGMTPPHQGKAGGAGEVGRQTPRPGGGSVYGAGAEPSELRRATISAATNSPAAMPFCLASPSGICASEAAYCASSADF